MMRMAVPGASRLVMLVTKHPVVMKSRFSKLEPHLLSLVIFWILWEQSLLKCNLRK